MSHMYHILETSALILHPSDAFDPDASALRCAPLAIENTTFCTVADMTTNGTSSGCDYETFVKNQQAFQAG